MTLPLYVDRRLRTARRRARFLCTLPLTLLLLFSLLLLPLLVRLYRRHYHPHQWVPLRKGAFISLSSGCPSHPGTSIISPCQPRLFTSHNITAPAALNLRVALSGTHTLLFLFLCNASRPTLPQLSPGLFYTTPTALLVPRNVFIASAGFDERLSAPDIEALYSRLESRLRRRHFGSTQSAKLRADAAYVATSAPLVSGPWSSAYASSYTVDALAPFSVSPRSAPSVVRAQPEAFSAAISRALHDIHSIPWDLLDNLAVAHLKSLAAALDQGSKLLVVHVAHGLGNRLRTLGSALAYARRTNRVVILVWPRDVHCAVAFHDLFEDDLFVVPHLPGWPFRRSARRDPVWNLWDVYNYMTAEGGLKDTPVVNSARHIYFRGAYVLVAPHLSDWATANAHLRRLTPVRNVRDRLATVEERLARSIGVHVRHLPPSLDIRGVDAKSEYGDFETRIIAYWRATCAPRSFITEIHQLRRQNRLRDVFVAADDPRWRHEIAAEVSSVWSFGDCQGRCEVEALVELLALAQCPVVLGSMWSSYSEAVQRFSGKRIRMAGVDFGKGAVGFGDDVDQFVADVLHKRRQHRGKH